MELLNTIQHFYTLHTAGEVAITVYLIYSTILTIIICYCDDDATIFFPFLILLAGIFMPIMWLGELAGKYRKKKFIKIIDKHYTRVKNQPHFIYFDISYKLAFKSYQVNLYCTQKNTFVLIDISSLLISIEFNSLDDIEKLKDKLCCRIAFPNLWHD